MQMIDMNKPYVGFQATMPGRSDMRSPMASYKRKFQLYLVTWKQHPTTGVANWMAQSIGNPLDSKEQAGTACNALGEAGIQNAGELTSDYFPPSVWHEDVRVPTYILPDGFKATHA